MDRTDNTTAQPAAPSGAFLDQMPVRFAVVTLLIAVLIVFGIAIDVSASQNRQSIYLLLTLPVTVLFQLLISRRPIRAVWVRAAPPFRLDALGIGIALLIAIAPAVIAVRDARNHDWILVLYDLAAIGGAFAAAYAIRAMQRATLRSLLLCLATAGVIGLGFILLHELGFPIRERYLPPVTRRDLDIGILNFLVLFPVVYVMEEVLFRGAIDSYIHRPGERADWTSWLSALFVSVLWGLWHIPIIYPETYDFPEAVLYVLPVQVTVGIPLSLWWRRSGNLTVTGTTHALIDAVRNALVGAP